MIWFTDEDRALTEKSKEEGLVTWAYVSEEMGIMIEIYDHYANSEKDSLYFPRIVLYDIDEDYIYDTYTDLEDAKEKGIRIMINHFHYFISDLNIALYELMRELV